MDLKRRTFLGAVGAGIAAIVSKPTDLLASDGVEPNLAGSFTHEEMTKHIAKFKGRVDFLVHGRFQCKSTGRLGCLGPRNFLWPQGPDKWPQGPDKWQSGSRFEYNREAHGTSVVEIKKPFVRKGQSAKYDFKTGTKTTCRIYDPVVRGLVFVRKGLKRNIVFAREGANWVKN